MATTYGVGTSVPHGWHYDTTTRRYIGPNGDIVSEMDIMQHGSLWKVLQNRQSGSFTIDTPAGEKMRIDSAGSLSVGNIQTSANITVMGKLGQITINLDTGELTMPPNVGRDAAIRDFWLGFQEHFQPTNKTKYEERIKQLEEKIEAQKIRTEMSYKLSSKEAAKHIANKVAKKYGNEKFIMIKPDDLIKFIQDF